MKYKTTPKQWFCYRKGILSYFGRHVKSHSTAATNAGDRVKFWGKYIADIKKENVRDAQLSEIYE